ncbi:serine/threonine-protein kinase Nek4-like [Elysia marginata]|uniref:Serine/threonine-protein kinase Nek4 n=1 Tax=Elysia marginata TaxID=1093978 RepID=A0AAV4GMX0_9GAST|nr:serine/threonine-protein kinase Nek4-like [Elysia marginata]
MVDTEFERIKVIGKGSYGEVWLAKHKKDKKQYVLKKMNLGKASKRERKSAEQEAKLLSKLKHPNIVSYKDSFETDSGFLFIAMQYCEGGDLYARLKEQKGVPLEERQVVEWFVQIAMALQYMHERNILHRDLKTQNIFLTKSKIIKVGDLGIARVLDSAGDMATTLIGTPYYMSPELFSNKPYNHKSDVWALGCCVYEMTTLKHAFNAKDMNSLVYKILKGRMPPMPRQYSADLLVLMKSMLHQDPEKRPSVNRILRDPYIKRNIALFLEDTKRNSRRPSTTNSGGAPASSRPPSASSRRDPVQAAGPTTPGPPEKPLLSSRSEPDSNSVSNQPKAQDQNQVPDPVPKPSLVRKASDSAARDLEPIREKQEENHKGTDEGLPGKEVQSPKKESAPRKKKFSLLNHANKGKNDEPEEKEGNKAANHGKPPLNQAKATKGNIPEPQKPRLRPEDKPRPLPQPPKVEESAGLPQMREGEGRSKSTDSSKSSSVSSSKEDNCISIDADTPRSLPNVSARQRRRAQKSETAGSIENPHSARLKLRPKRTESEKITRSEKGVVPTRPPRLVPARARQPSLNDSTSSSDESQRIAGGDAGSPEETPKEREKKRENKEMNNFISLLDTTLHLNHADQNSEEEEELIPVEKNRGKQPAAVGGGANSRSSSPPTPPSQEVVRPEPEIHKSVSMPSVETLTNTSRLMDRIRLLHKDCIQGVGYSVLKKAYEILDRIDEDEVEPKLVDLLGKDKFDEYAGKIWQLKFCEESLFMA